MADRWYITNFNYACRKCGQIYFSPLQAIDCCYYSNTADMSDIQSPNLYISTHITYVCPICNHEYIDSQNATECCSDAKLQYMGMKHA